MYYSLVSKEMSQKYFMGLSVYLKGKRNPFLEVLQPRKA